METNRRPQYVAVTAAVSRIAKEVPEMGDRIDEAKGGLKESIGDAVGDEEMEREGRSEKDAAKARRELEGALDEGRGKIEEEWGDLTDDPETEARGKARQAEGEAKRAG